MTPQLTAPAAPAWSATDAADRRTSRIFIHLAFISCILLQKFGLVLGDSIIFVSLPMFGGLLAWMLATGLGQLRQRSLLYFALCVTWFLISGFVALLYPDNRTSISLLALAALMLNYMLLLVGPSERFHGEDILKIFTLYCRICAVVGIVQYLAQFVGIHIFSFTRTTPFLSPILVETRFNYEPILHYGSSLTRSNGLFLVEAATFSKLLIFAIVVEFFILGQVVFLPVYAVAYLFSYSGTGVLSLILTLPIYALFDRRAAKQLAMFGIALLIGIGLIAIAFPDQFASLAGRATEFQREGTSGHARFFGQFDAIGAVSGELRSLVGLGPGATDRANFYTPGTGSAAMKMYIDYGLIGLCGFAAFLISAAANRRYVILPILLLVAYQFGGGQLLFTPLLVLIAMLCIWTADNRHPAQDRVS